MNRADFIDVLRDYLQQYFPASEVEEMIWDYEEYFDAGIASGKTEAEIITSLGSPKKIARDLAEELSIKNAKEKITNGSSKEKFINTSKLYAKKASNFLSRNYTKAKEKITAYLSNEENKGTVNAIGKFLLILALVIIACTIAFPIIMGLLSFIPVFIGMIVGVIAAIVIGFLFIPIHLPTAGVFFFGASILIGLIIVSIQIIKWIVKIVKIGFKRFKTWWKYRLNGGVRHE